MVNLFYVSCREPPVCPAAAPLLRLRSVTGCGHTGLSSASRLSSFHAVVYISCLFTCLSFSACAGPSSQRGLFLVCSESSVFSSQWLSWTQRSGSGAKARRCRRVGWGARKGGEGSRNWGQVCTGALGLLGHVTQAIPEMGNWRTQVSSEKAGGGQEHPLE